MHSCPNRHHCTSQQPTPNCNPPQNAGWMKKPIPANQLTPEALGCGKPGGAYGTGKAGPVRASPSPIPGSRSPSPSPSPSPTPSLPLAAPGGACGKTVGARCPVNQCCSSVGVLVHLWEGTVEAGTGDRDRIQKCLHPFSSRPFHLNPPLPAAVRILRHHSAALRHRLPKDLRPVQQVTQPLESPWQII